MATTKPKHPAHKSQQGKTVAHIVVIRPEDLRPGQKAVVVPIGLDELETVHNFLGVSPGTRLDRLTLKSLTPILQSIARGWLMTPESNG